MKKIMQITRFAFLYTLLIVVTPFYSSIAYANDFVADANGFYIRSMDVPEEAVFYAQHHLFAFLSSTLNASQSTIELPLLEMGQPFTMSYTTQEMEGYTVEEWEKHNTYYFPIWYNNEIIYTFRVYYDPYQGQYTGILSKYLVNELNLYVNKTSLESPFTLYFDNGNVMGIHEKDIQLILPNFDKEPENLPPIEDDFVSVQVVNTKEKLDYKLSPSHKSSDFQKLELIYHENQGRIPWCASYAVARILKFHGLDIIAADVMAELYPNESLEQRKTHGTTSPKILSFTKSQGFKKSSLTYGTISTKLVKKEINNSRPIYIEGENLNDKSSRHAFVLYGYDDSNLKYWISNPWDSKDLEEVIDYHCKLYDRHSDARFVWDRTIRVVK